MDELRAACATVAARARSVRVQERAVPAYAARLPLENVPAHESSPSPRDDAAAFWLTLDAINFGSGWFPTLRKLARQSGYDTIAAGITNRFQSHGPWSADDLRTITPREMAAVTGQDPGHELMALFAASLNDLGVRLEGHYGGSFTAAIDAADGSAVKLAQTLGSWDCFADRSTYDGLEIPFLKRAQIAAADLARAGAGSFMDLDRLTMFADNLVPHVLRLDGILTFDPELVARIDRQELIEHGSPEEVEIRACALHAVELIVAASPDATTAAQTDQVLWNRGRGARYKAAPRHRSRCTAY
jgi:Queuosine salvage protein